MTAGWFSSRWASIWRSHSATVIRRRRADYYEYLGERLQGGAAGKTLLGLFADDAARYGPRTARGRLASHWAGLCQEHGADIQRIWHGVFPEQELILLRTAQRAGAELFVATLGELARTVRLVDEVRRTLVQTLGVALLAVLVLLAMLTAVPYFTAPRLLSAFQGLPASLHGPQTLWFLRLADGVRLGWPWLAAGTLAACTVMLASLPRYTGALRPWLDHLPPWSLYRDFQALRFLALLALLLRRQGHRIMVLNEALARIAGGASPWMAWQAERMAIRMGEGESGMALFGTGLLDTNTRWYLQDMIQAYGMDEGVRRVRQRLESHTRVRLLAQALRWRWSLLLASLACLIGLALLHYGVIDELRRALLLFHAGV